MSSSRFIEYEVALLLAKYGKSALLQALAEKVDVAPEKLESILQSLPAQKPKARSRRKPSVEQLIDKLSNGHVEKAQPLRTLIARFENRSFLGELRDVKRFFEQHDRTLAASKSRVEAIPNLIRLLAELDLSELEMLCNAESSSEYSSLGIISDEILRSRNTAP